MMESDHPLARLLRAAGDGRFPPADGKVEVFGPPPGAADAVVAFTAHNAIAAGLPAEEVRRHLPDDPVTGPMTAGFLAWLGEALGAKPGMLDVVLTATRRDVHPYQLDLAEVGPEDAARHPRATRAARYRTDLRLFEERRGRGMVVLGRGLAGRCEVSVEVEPPARGTGIGRALIRAALGVAPRGEPIFAQVSPGNAASLRAFLAAGFHPIGSEVLFLTRPA